LATTVTKNVFNKDLADDSGAANLTINAKLNELTREERTRGIHELHGVADDLVQETSQKIVQTKLQEMNEATSSFQNDDTVATKRQ
jgi:hypothetical protein